MTAQEIFNIAVGVLLKQNKQSYARGMCYYRLPQEDGTCLKCAVGMIIPDEEYSEDIESKLIGGLFGKRYFSTEFEKILSEHEGLLVSLQSVHDGYAVKLWRDEFQQIASEHGLEWKFDVEN